MENKGRRKSRRDENKWRGANREEIEGVEPYEARG